MGLSMKSEKGKTTEMLSLPSSLPGHKVRVIWSMDADGNMTPVETIHVSSVVSLEVKVPAGQGPGSSVELDYNGQVHHVEVPVGANGKFITEIEIPAGPSQVQITSQQLGPSTEELESRVKALASSYASQSKAMFQKTLMKHVQLCASCCNTGWAPTAHAVWTCLRQMQFQLTPASAFHSGDTRSGEGLSNQGDDEDDGNRVSSVLATSVTLSEFQIPPTVSKTSHPLSACLLVQGIESGIFMLLALYVDQVTSSSGYGVPQHPLFCLGFGSRNQAASVEETAKPSPVPPLPFMSLSLLLLWSQRRPALRRYPLT